MRIHILTIGEPLPIEGQNTRLYRSGLFSQICADLGHDVLWWSSAFDHFQKRFHSDHNQRHELRPNLHLQLLKGCGYQKNISLERFRDHKMISQQYAQLAPKEEAPDVILVSVPIIELAKEALNYAKPRNIPVVLDARDMWPDIFSDSLPNVLKGLGKVIFQKQYAMTKQCFSQATAILGHTESFVDWGLKYAGRPRTETDRAFAHGYPVTELSDSEKSAAESYWAELGVSTSKPVVAFLGTISSQFDFDPVISAAKELPNVTVVIAGEGPVLASLKSIAPENVIFPGWVDLPKIAILLRIAKLGISPVRPKPDFEATIQNKAIEYMSAGLPILWPISRGVLADLIRERETGFFYQPDSAGSLKAVIEGALTDPEGLSRRAQNAQILFEERFRADRIYTEMAKHLEKIASSGYP